MLPKTVRIFGDSYKVKVSEKPLVSEDGERLLGYVHHTKKIIMLDEGQSEEELIITFCHEIGHILIRRLSFNQIISAEIEELIVDAFGKMYYESFILIPL